MSGWDPAWARRQLGHWPQGARGLSRQTRAWAVSPARVFLPQPRSPCHRYPGLQKLGFPVRFRSGVNSVHACRIRIQIECLPFPEHGFLPAGNHAAGFGINPFYDEVNLCAQHIAEDLVLAQHELRIFLSGRAAAHVDHHLF